MKNYIKPVLILNEELAEGVFSASGDVNCYEFYSRIVQTPQLGNEVYTIQIDGRHNAQDGHHSSARTLTIHFNFPVVYVDGNASDVKENGNSLTLTFTDGVGGAYHNNAIDNIGLGQVKVAAQEGLAIINTTVDYCNLTCGQPGH